MPPEPNVLVVDDNRDVLTAVRLLLEGEGMTVQTSTSPAPIPAVQAGGAGSRPDVILLDMNFVRGAESGEEGYAALAAVLERDPHAAVVLMTAYGDVDRAVRAMRAGAVDFIEKPWLNARLVASVRAAARLRHTRPPVPIARPAGGRHAPAGSAVPLAGTRLLGASRAMVSLRDTIARVAPTESDVLVLGENGTGKELVAAEIHRLSRRSEAPLIRVDLGALPEGLVEAELFGVERGAYTGAEASRKGRAELADGGTLFLDEIGNASPGTQAKLLSLLERREVVPLGSGRPRPVNVRVVSATNASLGWLAEEGAFRRDLLYRLNAFEVVVPPLRARSDDVLLLAGHFLAESAERYEKGLTSLSDEATRALRRHPWPGNVRELRHAVERAVILAPEGATALGPEGLPGGRPPAGPLGGRSSDESPAEEEDGRTVLDADLKSVEREAIRRALERTGWNISQAARELGLSRRSLYRRLEEHGL